MLGYFYLTVFFFFYSLESLRPCPFYLPQRVRPNINGPSGSATADFISTIALVSQGWGTEGVRKEAVIIELEQSFTSMLKNKVIPLVFLPILRSNVSCTSELKCTFLSWNLGYKPWLFSSFFFSRKILCSQSRRWVDQHGLGNLYSWRKILMGGSKLRLCCDVWSITNLHPRLPPLSTVSSLSPPDLQCSSNAFSSGQVGSRSPTWHPFTLQRPQQIPVSLRWNSVEPEVSLNSQAAVSKMLWCVCISFLLQSLGSEPGNCLNESTSPYSLRQREVAWNECQLLGVRTKLWILRRLHWIGKELGFTIWTWLHNQLHLSFLLHQMRRFYLPCPVVMRQQWDNFNEAAISPRQSQFCFVYMLWTRPLWSLFCELYHMILICSQASMIPAGVYSPPAPGGMGGLW